MQYLPPFPQNLDEGKRVLSGGVNIFPSPLPGLEWAGTLSAKELGDVTRDLFCLPFGGDEFTSPFSLCDSNEEGKGEEGEEEVKKKKKIDEACPHLCLQLGKFWRAPTTTTTTTTELITTDSAVITGILALSAETTTTTIYNTTTTAVATTAIEIINRERTSSSSAADAAGKSYCEFCDYFFYLCFRRGYKYFNWDEVICANEKNYTFTDMFIEDRDTKGEGLRPPHHHHHHAAVISESGDKNMFLNRVPKLFASNSCGCGGDFSNEICYVGNESSAVSSYLRRREPIPRKEFVSTPDYVPCKRLSNLFHAVPVLIEYSDCDTGPKEPDGGKFIKSDNTNDCDSSSLPDSDTNDNISRYHSNIVVDCFSDGPYTPRDCDFDGSVSKYHSNNGYEHKTNLASNMKSSQCQFFVGTGTVSDFAVSDDFGAFAKDLDSVTIEQECGDEKDNVRSFVGEVIFSVYGNLLSFPIFKDEKESKIRPTSCSSYTDIILATGGYDWCICVDNSGRRPVIRISEEVMADSLSGGGDNISSNKQLTTSRLYGFNISSNENSRIKCLIPIFDKNSVSKENVDYRRRSICTSVPLRRSSFVNRGHRNSAACDVEMYRNVQQFLPVKEGIESDKNNISGDPNFKVHSVVINNCPTESNVIDHTQCRVPVTDDLLVRDFESMPTPKYKEINSSDSLKLPCVLRSKSDSRIKRADNTNRETCRSISLNTSEAECPSNLSRFKGVTLLEDQELSSSELEAKTFLSSFLERSMNSGEKKDCVEQFEEKEDDSPIITSPSNLKTVFAVNTILSHINNAQETLTYPKTFDTTTPIREQNVTESKLSSAAKCENILHRSNDPPFSSSLMHSCLVNDCDPYSVKVSREISNSLSFPSSFTTSLTYTSSGVIDGSCSSPPPTTSASLISNCCVTNVTPLMTKMSVFPITKETSFTEAPSEHSVSYSVDNSGVQFSNYGKGKILWDHITEKRECLPPKLSRSASLKCRSGNVIKQQKTPPPSTRFSYSTKFPLDIICQGRLEEVKRKTAPPGEYSSPAETRDSFRRPRIFSAGQVKPLHENYPTSRSKSAGRMDLGRKSSFSKDLPRDNIGVNDIEKKVLDVMSNLTPRSCESPSNSSGFNDEFETLSVTPIQKHKLSGVIREESENDVNLEVKPSCISLPSSEITLTTDLERRSEILRNNKLVLSYIDSIVTSLINVSTLFPRIREKYLSITHDRASQSKCESGVSPQKQPFAQSVSPQRIGVAQTGLVSKSLMGGKIESFDVRNVYSEDVEAGRAQNTSSLLLTSCNESAPASCTQEEETPARTIKSNTSTDKNSIAISSPEKAVAPNQSIPDTFRSGELSIEVYSSTWNSAEDFKSRDSPSKYSEAVESFRTDDLLENFGRSPEEVVKLQRESESPDYFYSTSETPYKIYEAGESPDRLPKPNESTERFHLSSVSPDKILKAINSQERLHRSSESPEKFYSIIESFEQHDESAFGTDKLLPSSCHVGEALEAKDVEGEKGFSHDTYTELLSKDNVAKPSDHYINNIQILQLKPKKSSDLKVTEAPRTNVTTSVFSVGDVAMKVPLDNDSTCITKSDLCITTNSFVNSFGRTNKTPDLDICVANSPDFRISSRKSPEMYPSSSRETELVTRKERCQRFRESPDLAIKTSPSTSIVRTYSSSELDITVTNSPILSIRSSKSPDTSTKRRKSPDLSPDLIVSAQNIKNGDNSTSPKSLGSYSCARKSPDLIVNTQYSTEILKNKQNYDIVKEASSFSSPWKSREDIICSHSFQSRDAMEQNVKGTSPHLESNSFHCELVDDSSKNTRTEIVSLLVHNKDATCPPPPSGISEDQRDLSSSSLNTPYLSLEPNIELEKPPLQIDSDISKAPLPDVADVCRFPANNVDMDVATPNLSDTVDIDTVRSVFEVSHHKTVHLQEHSDDDDDRDTGVVLKSELKIDSGGYPFAGSLDLTSMNATLSSPDDSLIKSTTFSSTPAPPLPDDTKTSISTASTNERMVTDSTKESLAFYLDDILDFIDSEGTRRDQDPRVSSVGGWPHPSQEEEEESLATAAQLEEDQTTERSASKGGDPRKSSSARQADEIHESVSQRTVSGVGVPSEEVLSGLFCYGQLPIDDVTEITERESKPLFPKSERLQSGTRVVASVIPPPTDLVDERVGSSHSPVARRDLFPLEDDDVTPHWHALLEVNAPDSEEDEPPCFDTDEDDDFESMDAEMRRLEEKLKKFERELGGGLSSEGEEGEVTLGRSSNTDKKTPSKNVNNVSSVGLLRLRQEDIDVLRSFSLPEVYPPVNMLKTKHLSLLKKDEDILGEDENVDEDVGPSRKRQRTFSGSNNSSHLNVPKSRRRLKPGERLYRSLDERKLSNHLDSGSSIPKLPPAKVEDHQPFIVAVKAPSPTIEEQCSVTRIDDKAEEMRYIDEEITETSFSENRGMEEQTETYGSYSLYSEPYMDTDLTSSGYLVGEDLCEGVLWKEGESVEEFSLFDCYGLESLLNRKCPVGKDYIFFIFEDDDNDDLEVYEKDIGANYAEGLFLLPLSTDSSYHSRESQVSMGDPLQEEMEQGCRKKRDISLVSAFKNSFRKAAKYLGPVPQPSSSPKRKNHSNSPSFEVEGSPFREKDSDSFGGRYNVRTGHVQNVSSKDVDETSGSGEFYASPVLCIMTSDEERGNSASYLKSIPDPVTPSKPSSFHQSPSRTPPPVPPRKSLLMQNIEESEIIGRNEKQRHLYQNVISDSVFKKGSSPPAPKSTFLRHLTRKAKNLVEDKSKEIGHETSVPLGWKANPEGVGAEGNDKSLTSPHPKVLPEHRKRMPRGVSGDCAKCACVSCSSSSAKSFFLFTSFESASSCPEIPILTKQPPELLCCPAAKTNSGVNLVRGNCSYASPSSSAFQIYLASSDESHASVPSTPNSSPSSPSSCSSSSFAASDSEPLWVPVRKYDWSALTSADYILPPHLSSVVTNRFTTNTVSLLTSVNMFPSLTSADTNGLPVCLKDPASSFGAPFPPWDSNSPSVCNVPRGRFPFTKHFHYSASESDLDS